MKTFTFIVSLLCLLGGYSTAEAVEPLVDIRYCGTPKRDINGDIVRSQTVLKNFQKLHPCPSTGLPTGACPGWAKDHVVSLACGGCDAVFNLQWLPDDQKSTSDPHAKDRWERKVYYPLVEIVGTDNCKFEIVK